MFNFKFIQLFLVFGVLSGAVFVLRSAIYDEFFRVSVEEPIDYENSTNTLKEESIISTLTLPNPPEIIKAIYLSSDSAANEDKISYAINIAKDTEINSVVVDIKDFTGYIAYDTEVLDAEKYLVEKVKIKDIKSLIKRLHDENIYVIARVVIFQDPRLALARPDLAVHSLEKLNTFPNEKYTAKTLWRDNNGLSWIDPAAKYAWDYNIAIIKDAASHGFDEINLDYIRFPSDGALKDIIYIKWDRKILRQDVIKEFFTYLDENLSDIKISADLFGYTTTNEDDLGIGQIIENAFGSFDFVSPMVYPSHYSVGFLGHQSPASHPYDVVNFSMKRAEARLAAYKSANQLSSSTNPTARKLRRTELRPWLQDFTIRGVYYGPDKVKAQIKATEDALGENYKGYMLWNARNVYTEEAIH